MIARNDDQLTDPQALVLRILQRAPSPAGLTLAAIQLAYLQERGNPLQRSGSSALLDLLGRLQQRGLVETRGPGWWRVTPDGARFGRNVTPPKGQRGLW